MKPFEFIKEILNNHPEFWNELTDKEKTEFVPFLMMKWFNGAQKNRQYHVMMTNE